MSKFGRQLPNDSIAVITDFEKMKPFHNYEKEIKRLGLKGKLKYGEISLLNVAHDGWCGIYNRDRCDCKPVIQNRLTGKIIK